jgi:uncharacterized membrane protein (DUF106 family)
MNDYELKKLQERRLEMLQNASYYFAISLGILVIIFKIIILFAL